MVIFSCLILQIYLELELELENSLFDTYKYTYIIYEKEHVIEEATQV